MTRSAHNIVYKKEDKMKMQSLQTVTIILPPWFWILVLFSLPSLQPNPLYVTPAAMLLSGLYSIPYIFRNLHMLKDKMQRQHWGFVSNNGTVFGPTSFMVLWTGSECSCIFEMLMDDYFPDC